MVNMRTVLQGCEALEDSRPRSKQLHHSSELTNTAPTDAGSEGRDISDRSRTAMACGAV